MSHPRLISFLSALCLFLAAVENAIPKPLPFLRLGLANLPVILALFLLRRRQVFSLVLFKVLAQGVISGTLFSYIFLFSAGGSFASALAMMAIYEICGKRKGDFCEENVSDGWQTNERKFLSVSAVGISLAGALANTFAQLILARFFLFGENTKYIAPVLLVSGLITGFSLGVFAELFMQKSKWFKARLSERSVIPTQVDSSFTHSEVKKSDEI